MRPIGRATTLRSTCRACSDRRSKRISQAELQNARVEEVESARSVQAHQRSEFAVTGGTGSAICGAVGYSLVWERRIGMPVASGVENLEASYLPRRSLMGWQRSRSSGGSLFLTLAKSVSDQIAYANEEVDATGADKRAARLLRVAEGAPILRISQVIYSTSGQAILYVLGLYRSDRHKLLIRRWRR
jgi:hypothetical protein